MHDTTVKIVHNLSIFLFLYNRPDDNLCTRSKIVARR